MSHLTSWGKATNKVWPASPIKKCVCKHVGVSMLVSARRVSGKDASTIRAPLSSPAAVKLLQIMVQRKFTESDVTGAVWLTLPTTLSGRVVERKAQGDQGSNLQDDEGDVLQGLPYQLQEGFWLFWRYQVFTKYFFSLVQVSLGTCKTWERKTETEADEKLIMYKITVTINQHLWSLHIWAKKNLFYLVFYSPNNKLIWSANNTEVKNVQKALELIFVLSSSSFTLKPQTKYL